MKSRAIARSASRFKLLARAIAIAWIVVWWIWLIGYQHTFAEVDAQAYWGLDLESLYRGDRLGDQGAFLYSPAVALLFLPFTFVPYEVFYAALAAINLVALIYLVGWELAAIGLFLVPISNEVARGNIHLLLAVAIVLGFRHPGSWAWPLLTKATPGIGILWFALRREWRSLGIALVVTTGLVAVTVILVPELWMRWIALLWANADATRPNAITQVPVLPRMALAAGVLVLAAWRGIPALVPVASLIALPAIWVNSLAMLVAVIPLIRDAARTPGSAALHPDHLPIEELGPSPRLARDDPP